MIPVGEPNLQELIAGKYRLTHLVGRGGMGSVWEGVHTSLGTRVAIKFIESEFLGNPEARNRFENEARAAAALRSRHVVQVFDHGVTSDGRPYIVMEFLSGEPLDKRLDRLGRLDPLETARMLVQVCRALARAHQAGIVHRDLKPENIFLVTDAEEGADLAKVVDFGIAKFAETSSLASATRTGSVLGTPYYMSPEQARGLRSVDHRSDIWSVGDLLVTICTAPLPVPTMYAPDIPTGFNAWFARALSRPPDQRFASANEAAEALCEAMGISMQTESWGTASRQMVSGVSTPSALPRAISEVNAASTIVDPAPRRRSRAPLLVGGAAAALAAAGFAFFQLQKADGHPSPDMAVAVPPQVEAAALVPPSPQRDTQPVADSPEPSRAVPAAAPAASSASAAVAGVQTARPVVATRRAGRTVSNPPASTTDTHAAPVVEAPPATKAPEPPPESKATRPPKVDIDKNDPWRQ
jgi:eukaryotic-like serine/threonine-protein kinase